ncbi:hypothetical protein [Natronolimnohabitans innermongolicus]|nr:hypothetical protein [Natronolimnohabitans innermongolicus]
MAASTPPRPSTEEDDRPSVGMAHLTVVPANFEPDDDGDDE